MKPTLKYTQPIRLKTLTHIKSNLGEIKNTVIYLSTKCLGREGVGEERMEK
jgi:hypothetical protein